MSFAELNERPVAVERFLPPVPQTPEDLGLPPGWLEHSILKLLYFKGDLTGRQLSTHLGLNFSVIESTVELLKRQHHIVVKSSLGMGLVSAVITLTESGRQFARESLEANSYVGPVPVPLAQYTRGVVAQRKIEGWLTPSKLKLGFKSVSFNDDIIRQVGPAVNSGKSLLIYGQPGNGKTFLAETIGQIEDEPVYIPYAIEAQGQIIQVFDPLYHRRTQPPEEEEESVFTLAHNERAFDGRWVEVHRPFIVTGGELTLDMLDLTFNPATKVYDAPFHLKATNGIYLIDDFGRQKVSPGEVLNRWIVPMERGHDFLSLRAGGKIPIPFAVFLIFSTNLKPDDLGDEAFLRRIQYKMFLRSPNEQEFLRLIEKLCQKEKLRVSRFTLDHLLNDHYKPIKKPFRRCQPRDLVTHALDLIRFESLPMELTEDLIDRAFESTFVCEAYED
jgi:hypothetical protein